MQQYGLIGQTLKHSFSARYFADKFEKEGIQAAYQNYELSTIDQFPNLLQQAPNIVGLNVTIPYKTDVIPFLDELDDAARKIGAVNTIHKTKKGLKGYNTDVVGFDETLNLLNVPSNCKALVLGTGGASKAVHYVLRQRNIAAQAVSRSGAFTYDDLTDAIIAEHQIIINTTPLGTFPDVNECPKIPYQQLTKNHFLVDLVYNPAETKFLQLGKAQGCKFINGYPMLVAQAEAAWRIWQLE